MSNEWGQQSPNNGGQQPWGQQPWGQQSPNNGGQQPWGQQPPLNPGQFRPLQPLPKKKRTWLWIILSIVGMMVLCGFCGIIISISSSSATTTTSTKTPAQTEAGYKASTMSTTVTNLYKEGSTYQGKDVHFTSKILGFIKDSNGKTNGANVLDQNSASFSTVQVLFTNGSDITQLNQGDILEVWGTDQGVFNETNGFGGPVQTVVIQAKYMKDQTTNYQADTYVGALTTLTH